MEVIIDPQTLQSEFSRLLKEYQNYAWSVAWASSSSELYKELLKNENKINKITVGLHFYQTHPDFIESFMTNNNMRFIKQPSGTFHPKLYAFYNNPDEWEIIIGSANFTDSAFSKNDEANVLLTSADSNANKTYEKTMELVNRSWEEGRKMTEKELDNYRKMWVKLRPKLNSLSNEYGGGNKGDKPAYNIPIIKKTWEEYVKAIKAEEIHRYTDRINVLQIARNLFNETKHFKDIALEERKYIAGMPNNSDVNGTDDWGLFGSMKGAGKFKNRIIENDKNISKALDQIPLAGQITKTHFDKYLHHFERALDGNYIATATRLLCMKRPDVFVCLDSKNREALCSDFDITHSNINYQRYWEEIIERIYDCEWWQNPNPKNEEERQISEGRAAFLDSLYFER